MSVTAPPRPPSVDPQREPRDPELLIEEARRRARRRRVSYATLVAVVLGIAGVAFVIGGGGAVDRVLGRSASDGPPSGGSAAQRTSVAAGRTLAPGPWPVSALALDPRSPDTLYAGGSGSVFRSTNGGESWRDVTAEPWTQVYAIVVDPTRSQTVYVATERGIAKTADGGASWRLTTDELFRDESEDERSRRLDGAGQWVRDLFVDPRSGAVYAATDLGLLKSTDGERWVRVRIGPRVAHRPGSYGRRLPAVALDPHTPGALYAAWVTHPHEQSYGPGPGVTDVYRTTDEGRSWRRVGEQLARNVLVSLVVDPHVPGTLYGIDLHLPGLLRSTDGGRTWHEIGPGKNVGSLVVDPVRSGTLYVTASGLHRSTDGGATWRPVAGRGLPSGAVADLLAVDPRNPDILHVAGWRVDGIAKSRDRGRTWTPSSSGLVAANVHALAIAPGIRGTIYAAAGNAVFVTTDRGKSWRTSADSLEGRVRAIAVDPRGSGTGYSVLDGYGFYVTRSESWWRIGSITGTSERRPLASAVAIAIDPSHPETIYAAATQTGIFKSLTGGRTWRRVSTLRPIALALDPRDPATLYAGTAAGLFRSADAGESWRQVADGTVTHVAVAERNPHVVYAGTRMDGVLTSVDGGTTWHDASAGLGRDAVVTGLVVDPQRPGTAYVATEDDFQASCSCGGIVYRTTDGGESWRELDSGLGDTLVNALAISPDGRRLYVATSTWGVVDLRLDR